MTEAQGGFRPPWRRGRRTEAVPEPTPPVLLWHVASVPVGPQAVRRAREAMTACLPAAGVTPGSAFADAVLLALSELVTNVVRHAPRSPVTDVGLSVAAGQLIVSVSDAEPRLPDLTPEGMGAGLWMVTELAAAHGGGVGARPAADHDGKVVLVRFGLPSYDGNTTGSGRNIS